MKGRPEHDRDDRRGFNANAALDASPRVAARPSSSARLPPGTLPRGRQKERWRGLFDPLRAGLHRQSNPTVDYFQYMYTVPTGGAGKSRERERDEGETRAGYAARVEHA